MILSPDDQIHRSIQDKYGSNFQSSYHRYQKRYHSIGCMMAGSWLNCLGLICFFCSNFQESQEDLSLHTMLLLQKTQVLSLDLQHECSKLLWNHLGIELADHPAQLFHKPRQQKKQVLVRPRYTEQPSLIQLNLSYLRSIYLYSLIKRQLMEEGKAKGLKMDLICNSEVDLWNSEELKYAYFESGSIYLGSKEALNEEIYQKNIGAVLTIMDLKSYEKQKIKEKMNQIGLHDNHLYIDSEDHKEAELKKFYEAAFNFIEKSLEEGRNVLVHCKGGMSRSPAILCSYLMKKYKIDFDKCYQLLKSRRNVVSINEGFQKELKKYQGQLKKVQK